MDDTIFQLKKMMDDLVRLEVITPADCENGYRRLEAHLATAESVEDEADIIATWFIDLTEQSKLYQGRRFLTEPSTWQSR